MSKNLLSTQVYQLTAVTYLFYKQRQLVVTGDAVQLLDKAGKAVFTAKKGELIVSKQPTFGYMVLSNGTETVRLTFSSPKVAVITTSALIALIIILGVAGYPALSSVALVIAVLNPGVAFLQESEDGSKTKKDFMRLAHTHITGIKIDKSFIDPAEKRVNNNVAIVCSPLLGLIGGALVTALILGTSDGKGTPFLNLSLFFLTTAVFSYFAYKFLIYHLRRIYAARGNHDADVTGRGKK